MACQRMEALNEKHKHLHGEWLRLASARQGTKQFASTGESHLAQATAAIYAEMDMQDISRGDARDFFFPGLLESQFFDTFIAMLTTMILHIRQTAFTQTLAALLTPTIAAIAVLIAYEQFVINRRQHQLALFEKRWSIFNATAKFIAGILQEANVTIPQCIQLLQDTRDSNFLFEQDANDFINEVYQQATALHAHMAMGAEHAQQGHDVMEWFAGKIAEARTIFGRYLDFRKP